MSLDTDWLWRVLLARIGEAALVLLEAIGERLTKASEAIRRGPGANLVRLLGSSGPMGRTWQVGTTAMWISILLTAYVLLYYL